MNGTTAAKERLENATRSTVIVPSKAEGIALCTAFILSFLLIAVGNLLTIIVFAVDKRLRKRSLILVINMAFADLMLGTVALPMYIYQVGADYKIWEGGSTMSLDIFFKIFDTFFMIASLNSAAFISGERLYAIYWPLKHRKLSLRGYCIVILMVWILAFSIAALWTVLNLFISTAKLAMYAWISNALILIFIICGCNFGIWRKFQHGIRSVASQQRNRASQNKRLTRTLMCVSLLALLSWLPLIVLNCLIVVFEIQIPFKFYDLVNIINYSNSFVNPFVYALRIPEFRETLVLCCSRRPAAPNIEKQLRRNKKSLSLTPAIELRRVQTEPASNLQLAFEQEVFDTKL